MTTLHISEPLTEAAPAGDPRLHSVRNILIATLLGTPLAGGILMASNAKELGRESPASFVAFGAGLTVASFVLAFVLPDAVPGIVVWLPMLLATKAFAVKKQGRYITHRAVEG